MVNLKKILATALAATMVISASFTAFAEDTAPVTEGSADGTGSNEGHVDKDVVDVVLPTNTTDTFNYTMDPERLITATDAAKYAEGTVFPEKNDTGVYFLTDTNTYGNTSNTVQVINKGAVDQMLTVKAKLTASDGGKDIPILNAAPATDATTAGLYLTATVAKATQALSTTETSWIINLTGNADNYEVAVKDNKYVFQKKTSDLAPWKAADIAVTGAVTNGVAVAADTTAPKITLTWKFEAIPETAPSWTSGITLSDYTDAPANAAPSIATTAYTVTATDPLNVTVNLGAGEKAATGISSVVNKGTGSELNSTAYSFSGTTLTFSKDHLGKWVTVGGAARTYVVKFNDTEKTEVELVLTPASE